jgi:hypothetical protein
MKEIECDIKGNMKELVEDNGPIDLAALRISLP